MKTLERIKKNHLNVISFAIPSHTRLSTALFFSLPLSRSLAMLYRCCVHSDILSLSLSLSTPLTLYRCVCVFLFALNFSLSLSMCVCELSFLCVHFSHLLIFQHVIEFFVLLGMKHHSPQICSMIRSNLVAAVAPNRISSMHHDATTLPPINQQPIVHFWYVYSNNIQPHHNR